MRKGRLDQAAALAVKIDDVIKRHNSAERCRVDVMSDPRNMWAKVRQLTGRAESSNHKSDITAAVLNSHYASVSTDDSYIAPSVKLTAVNQNSFNHIAEWRMFDILDNLRPTSAGLDEIPAWFLRIGAPLFAKPIAAIMNLSLSSAVVPQQWKKASILPIPKIQSPQFPSDFRPI